MKSDWFSPILDIFGPFFAPNRHLKTKIAFFTYRPLSKVVYTLIIFFSGWFKRTSSKTNNFGNFWSVFGSTMGPSRRPFSQSKLALMRAPISAAEFPHCELFTNRFRLNFVKRFLGSKKSNVPTQFFRIRPTSGFIGNFQFNLVFQISRYTINQWKLEIAQIEV